jgi:AcrR family transcriptional regulator
MRQSGNSSQTRLRAAAKALFAERGYEETAISDITRAAGTSHSQFLKYYSGKQELRREIIDEQWAELTKSVVLASISVSSPTEKLRLALNMFISFLEADPQFRAILLLEEAAMRQKGAVTVSRAFREFVAVFDDILNAMKTARQSQEGIDIQALRSALLGSVEGMMRDQLLSSANFPAQYSVEQVRSMLSVMIDAACEFQRPSREAQPLASGEPGAGSEEAWIRYYLKLADKALHPTELS